MPEVIQIGSGKAGILTSSCATTRFLLLATFTTAFPQIRTRTTTTEGETAGHRGQGTANATSFKPDYDPGGT